MPLSLRARNLPFALAAALAGTASGQPAAPSTYLLTAVARTGGPDRCFGVPPDSTITNSTPAIDRAGNIVLRFHDTAARADGLIRFDPRAQDAGHASVIAIVPRPDALGLQPALARTIALSAGVIASPRLDQPGLIDLRSLAGDLLAQRAAPVSPSGGITRVALAGEHLALSSGSGADTQVATRWIAPVGDVVVQRVLVTGAGSELLELGPADITPAGDVYLRASTPAGDALLRWTRDGTLEHLVVALDAPDTVFIGPNIDARDDGAIAFAALTHSAQWELRLRDPHGVTSTLASEAPSDPSAPSFRPDSIPARTPALNAAGEVAFVADDGGGPALYLARGPGQPARVIGWDDQVQAGPEHVRVGLGSGDERQVVVSDPALNDFGEIAVVVRLRDGTAALVRAVPVRALDCPADFNGDGLVDADDLGDFINAFFNPADAFRADFNRDGFADADDLGDFINAYFTSDCTV